LSLQNVTEISGTFRKPAYRCQTPRHHARLSAPGLARGVLLAAESQWNMALDAQRSRAVFAGERFGDGER
jgi:hypothetical protein